MLFTDRRSAPILPVMTNSNTCQRVFLGWDRPLIDSACQWLLNNANSDSHIDLSHLNILSTVGRAARHLIEQLTAHAEQQGLGLSPPNIISISGLYENLLPDRRIVNQLDSEMIFFSIIKSSTVEELKSLFPNLKSDSTERTLFEKARFLSSTYQEFTKNGDSALDSIDKLLASALIPNEERWLALKSIFERYQNSLRELALLDTQSALLELESDKTRQQQTHLLLLACHDLTPILKRTIKAGYKDLSALIFAPEAEESGFDEIGCLKPKYWEKRPTDFDASSIKIVKSSKDQAYQLFSCLASYQQKIPPSQITIGSLEPGMDRLIETVANRYDIPVHLPEKKVLAASAPALALTNSLKFAISKKFSDLSTLVSLSCVSSLLPFGAKSLEIINKYREGHLQPLITGSLPAAKEQVLETIEAVLKLLEPLFKKKLSIEAWVDACNLFLNRLFGDKKIFGSALCEAINSLKAYQSKQEVNADLFLYVLTSFLEKSPDTEEASETNQISDYKLHADCIDVVGWLELALDNAAYTFIVSFNEGFVPAAESQSAFLPNQVRTMIALEDNSYRLARDTFLLETFLSSKKNLVIFAARNSLENTPLLPSRLALRGHAEMLAKNILQFFSTNPESIQDEQAIISGSGQGFKSIYKNNLLPRKRENLVSTEQAASAIISVTSISDYLLCPYSFYLRHVLKLRSANPDSRELSALQFGILIHDIISTFSTSALANETCPDKIESYLLALLKNRFEHTYGSHPFAEALIQYHQLISRLKKFAQWQAAWRTEGWIVDKVELDFEEPGYLIKTDSGNAYLRGRIDRIDFNPSTSEYAVIDFKSAELGTLPDKALSKSKGWTDLQLPIYLFYASDVLKLQNVKTAILPISASQEMLTIKWSNWDDSEIESAWQTLTTALKAIINQEFWPPKIAPQNAYDFESIYRAQL